MQTPKLKHTSVTLLATAAMAFAAVSYAGTASADAAARADAKGPSPVASQAVQGVTAERGHGHKQHRKHHGMKDVALWIPGYGPVGKDVVESLSLDSKQTALLKDAQEYSAAQFEQRTDRKGARGAARQGVKPGAQLDPHGAAKEQQARFADMQKRSMEGTQKWLNVWDSLEPAQQQTLAAHVSQKAEKRAERRAQRQAERESIKTDTQ